MYAAQDLRKGVSLMKNFGKVFRFIIGFILLSILFLVEGNLKYLGLIGLFPILTAVFNFCPLRSIFCIKTCKIKK